MKLHYTKILLFYVSFSILVTSSSNAHNKKKLYITRYIPNATSRVLSECDIPSSIYDNDPDMKSVKENFDRQTSQRFEEYDERMKDKRRKCKEQCDKDIQEIIEKDKINKSLAQKVEKDCLRCGCGLGGVAAGVGIFGALGTYGWKVGATARAIELAAKEGIKAGIDAVITQIKITDTFNAIWYVELPRFINESNYKTVEGLYAALTKAINSIRGTSDSITRAIDRARNGILHGRDVWLDQLVTAGENATASKTAAVELDELAKVTTASSNAYNAIGYSVTAILIIVLVMIIIYLILRYRRKKKMNKKLQYTKLLNQ
ncbi:PIR protein, putative [Plasmodium sp. gorilla clade G1]|nr:PIR protein, putative [Plasmodium sp. gorilla clade G1]